jgi:hypothetical protein
MIVEAVERVKGLVPGRLSNSLPGASEDARPYRTDEDTRRIRDGFDNERQALHTMKRIWEEGRTRLYPKLQKWEANALFFQGKHWANFPDIAWSPDEDLYRYNFPDKSDAEVRTSANLIRKYFMGWVARMTRNMPRVHFTPLTTDEDDKDRADVLNKIAQFMGGKPGEKRFVVECFISAGLWASAFLKGYHDPRAGDLVHPLDDMAAGDLEMLADPQIGPAVFGDDYEAMAGLAQRGVNADDMEPEGKVCGKVIPPYAITVINPHDVDLHAVPFIMESRVETRAWVKERYPDIDVDAMVSLESDGGWAHQLHFLQRTNDELLSQVAGIEGEADGEHGEALDTFDLVLVHEAYGRPTRDRKRGIKCVVAGNVIAELGDNPYHHQELPYTQFVHTLDMRSLYGNCDFDGATEVQHQLNQTLSQILTNRDRTANPPILDEGSGIDWNNVLWTPGEILPNQPGRRPEPMKIDPLPAHVSNLVPEQRFILQEMFDDHSPTQGVSRAGDSGVKTRMLQQAGEVRLATTAELFAEAYSEHWVQRICLYAQYQDRAKTGYVIGDMYDRSYFSFDRAAILGDGARSALDAFPGEDADRAQVLALKQQLDCQVTVQPGKSLNTVREDMMNLAQLQMLDPQRHAAKIWEMYGYHLEAQEVMAEERQHASKASMENDIAERGGMLNPPGVYERHEIHIEVHKRFVNSMRFERMAPEAQQAVIAHLQMHELAVHQEPLRQAYIQQAAQIQMMSQYGPLAPTAPAGPEGEPNGGPGAGGPPPAGP